MKRDEELGEIEEVLNTSWNIAWNNRKNINRIDRFKDVAAALQSYMDRKVLEGRIEQMDEVMSFIDSFGVSKGILVIIKQELKQKLKEQEKG